LYRAAKGKKATAPFNFTPKKGARFSAIVYRGGREESPTSIPIGSENEQRKELNSPLYLEKEKKYPPLYPRRRGKESGSSCCNRYRKKGGGKKGGLKRKKFLLHSDRGGRSRYVSQLFD